jgi:acetylornithine deacetylase
MFTPGRMTAELDPVAIAMDLMRADSTSGREGPAIDAAERLLVSRGWTVRRIPVTPGRDNLLAESAAAPVVCFSTHLDTVPPYIPPTLEADRLAGRGACDAKGTAAAMICAAEALRARGTGVALLFLVGEEVSHDGAHAANQVSNTTRVLINGEPTESALGLGTKGALRFIVRTRGRAVHSAYPQLGRSATADLVALLAELDGLALPSDALLGETTVNIGNLSGGVADNVTAPVAEARLMARLVVSADDTLAVIRRWVGDRAEIVPGETVPPVRLTALPGFPSAVLAYATDIPNLGRWGTPYLFGPGSISVAHSDDEFVSVAELRAAVPTYVRLAEAALARHLDVP